MVTVRDETLPAASAWGGAAVHVRAAAVPEGSQRFKTTTAMSMWSCDTEQRCRQALALPEGFDQAHASPDQHTRSHSWNLAVEEKRRSSG